MFPQTTQQADVTFAEIDVHTFVVHLRFQENKKENKNNTHTTHTRMETDPPLAQDVILHTWIRSHC